MAEIAGIVVPAVVTVFVQPVVDLLKEKYKAGKNSLSLADVHDVLDSGLSRLRALRKDKENEVLSHIEQNDPTEVYKDWKKNVSNIEEKVTCLNTEYEEVKEKKWYHCGAKGRFLEKIKKALSIVIKLLGDECLQNILGPKLPVERVIKEIGVQPIEEYPTLKKALDDTQALLKDERVNCVALGGQKGVGKTTIMQHLNNHHFNDNRVDKEFDMVLFIRVAADEHTDLQILHKIADRIKVDKEVNENEVARRIQKVLENKRYLLILDGLIHTLDGIWGKLDLSDHKKDSKVVIASHYPLALISTCVNRKVELNKLSDTEARKMFLNIVGKCLRQDKALLICDRFCYCLPLLIDPIARSFKYQPAPSTDWQQALYQWTRWPQVGVEGIKELYSNLEICYERLGDESKKKCFLYASLHPANSKIYTHYFVECCIVQELLEKTDATAKYSGMRSRATDVTLKHLVNVAFLEEGEEMRYVKMNDLYRQLALHISSNEIQNLKLYVDEEEAITSASCQRPIWLSMVGSKKDSLPANQNFSSLQTLMLQKNLKLDEISKYCLSGMRNLLVLNLYGTKIRELPSLSKLTKLKALYLNGCSDLQIEVSQIQSLEDLQVLDIRGTRINSVPSLKRLWCLRLSYIQRGDCDGISGLENLEELIIEVKSPEQWANDANCIAERVASLKNLTTFRCGFPS